MVSKSSTELEYRALAYVSYEIAWLEPFLKELSFPLPEIPITWCDNINASALTMNPVYHTRTKHIEVDVHFVRDKVLEKKLDIRYVPSQDQIADCLTEPLSTTQFNIMRDKLVIIARPLPLPSLRGVVNTQWFKTQ